MVPTVATVMVLVCLFNDMTSVADSVAQNASSLRNTAASFTFEEVINGTWPRSASGFSTSDDIAGDGLKMKSMDYIGSQNNCTFLSKRVPLFRFN